MKGESNGAVKETQKGSIRRSGALSSVRKDIARSAGGQVRSLRVVCGEIDFERIEVMTTYTQEALDLAELIVRKQMAYGDSFGRSQEIIRVLYPGGIRPDQYLDALAVIRVIDKLFRIANQRTAFGEDPWRDIAGYGLLATFHHKKQREAHACR